MALDQRPLVLHVMYQFDVGGLENGVINLINHMPQDAYRHSILALTDVSTNFAARLTRQDVKTYALHKPPGQGFWLYPKVVRLLKEIKPSIVHTRNLAALEMVVPSWLAGVPVRIHGEHGRDVEDLDGTVRRYQWLRRLYKPFVSRYVALSQDLAGYLAAKVHVPAPRMAQIYNGVDTAKFVPRVSPAPIPGCPFDPAACWLIGTVGRMQTVKDQLTLARAFVQVLAQEPALRGRLRLVMVGDGPLRSACQALLDEHGVADLCWLPGERSDVPAVMQGLHCFVLPSLAEGVSNTILEAMASGLPVVATQVGGNAELIVQGRTGLIVPASRPPAMAAALVTLANDPQLARQLGQAGRAEVESRFSLSAMVNAYRGLYDQSLATPRCEPSKLAA
jgi:sugar transferase (PEP-CTERM/EpsH1 system associated)